MRFKIILALVNDDYQDEVINAAKDAGATGVTILNARGEGIHKNKSFFGLTMETQKDMLLFLVEDFKSDEIMEAIYNGGHLNEHGNGIAFCWTIDRAIGLESQLPVMEKDTKIKYF
ncbi:MAG: P-II family nitrogen regulator [Nitrospinae bacterium]|jgi:nitrogen regulatory protein P-II 1|nr:P-II family nitrogen regulator [Nitrospinota bacterium]MDA1108381.1 P-II family nitrogen regulator [Nitrospinota bacterium]